MAFIWQSSDLKVDFEEYKKRCVQTMKATEPKPVDPKYFKRWMEEMTVMVDQIRKEYERKEKSLYNKMKNTAPMPDVDFDYARRGMTVFNGKNGRVCYLIKGEYRPKMVDNAFISSIQAKKMRHDIYFLVEMVKSKIYSISTRRIKDLAFFDHYHQAHPDCWGSYRWPEEINSPEELFHIIINAETVLENINTHSIARRDPKDLPEIDVLKKKYLRKTLINKRIVKNKSAWYSRSSSSEYDEYGDGDDY